MSGTNTSATSNSSTASEGTDHAYFQTWVPFQSGMLKPREGAGESASKSGTYTATYGLKSPFAPQQMGTFLHLGALDPEMSTLDKINGVTDEQKKGTYKRAYNLAHQVTQFVDDYRHRGSKATNPDALQNESRLLHQKGGWRDHTDGNRISTTVGDKVEVIGGNSVLVILGRPTKDNNLDPDTWAAIDDNPTSTHQIESSGWMGYENDGAPGHVEEVRWVDNELGGTWMVREKTYANDTVSIGSGSVRESFVGQSVELSSGDSISYHGRLSEIPPELRLDTAFNPATIMRDEQDAGSTFPYNVDGTAENFIDSVRRNAAATFKADKNAQPPVLVEQSQAIKEYARLDSVLSDTIVTGNVTETTIINGSETETTIVGGDTTESNTVSGTVTDSLTAKTVNENLKADHVASTTAIRLTKSETETVGGNFASVTAVGGMMEEVTVVGVASVSVMSSVGQSGITLIPFQAEIEVTVDRFNLFIGVGKQEIDLCPFVYEYGGDKLEFSAVGIISAASALTISSPLVNIEGVINVGLPPVTTTALATSTAALIAAAPVP